MISLSSEMGDLVGNRKKTKTKKTKIKKPNNCKKSFLKKKETGATAETCPPLIVYPNPNLFNNMSQNRNNLFERRRLMSSSNKIESINFET